MRLRLSSLAVVYFDTVRVSGSIRQAARHLNVASSAVNRQILNLEADIGMKLFDRLPGGLRLTPAGEVLARHVTGAMRDARETVAELAALQGGQSGEIGLAAIETANVRIIPEAMAAMATRFPSVRVRVRTVGSHAVPPMVASGEADLGLSFWAPENAALTRLALHRSAVGAVLREDHPLAAEDGPLRFEALLGSPLILGTPDVSINTHLSTFLARHRERLHVIAEVGSYELMRALVRRTGAVGFQARLGLSARGDGLVHRAILGEAETGELSSALALYRRPDGFVSGALAAFIELLRMALADDGVRPPP